MENGSDWLTYAEAGERLSISAEAARQRAKRGRWHKTLGNDGKPRIRLPDGWSTTVRPPVDRSTTTVRPADERLLSALEAHVETLKGELTLERERNAKTVAELEGEQERAAKAIADYQRLAEAFEKQGDAISTMLARPWWQRLAG